MILWLQLMFLGHFNWGVTTFSFFLIFCLKCTYRISFLRVTKLKLNSINTGPLTVAIAWDELAADYANPILMSRGGPSDTYGFMNIEIINFETTMSASQAYLGDAGRLMIDCPHTSGHTWPPGLSVPAVVSFFKAHPLGIEALYENNGLPADLASLCEIVSAAE